jgi:hypothetical protein
MSIAIKLRAGSKVRYGLERLKKNANHSSTGYRIQEITKRFPPTWVLNAPAAKDERAQSGARMHHKVSNALTPLSSGSGPIGSNIFARVSRRVIAPDDLKRSGGFKFHAAKIES